MESQYRQFEESGGSDAHRESISTQTGIKRIVPYILYSILVLLLLILLLVTGIKFSQLNKEISDVQLQLKNTKSGELTSNLAAASKAKCSVIKDVFLEELVPVRGPCTAGWVRFQRSCYLFSTSVAAWQKAEEQCKLLNGHLLVLNNVEELDYISRVVEIRYNYWIGLVERQPEGPWSWVDGTDFNSTPKFWNQGQPDDWDLMENGEDCGQLHESARRKRKLWNDADCSLKYRYICEAEA